MILKTLTWNIGGGKLLAKGADPGLMASYTVDGISSVIDVIKKENPDIITLQETQKSVNTDQIEYIANAIDYEHYQHDLTSESHLDADSDLGHGIISRYPITAHQFGFFYNPHVEVVWEDGRKVTTFDKGYTNCWVDINNTIIQVSTLHLLPFKRFNIELDSSIGKSVLADIEDKVALNPERLLLQGDFNIDSKTLEQNLPRFFTSGVKEIITEQPTTPKGRTYDHVLYKGIRNLGYKVDDTVLTDHYPVMATFEI